MVVGPDKNYPATKIHSILEPILEIRAEVTKIMDQPVSIKRYSPRHRHADIYEIKSFRERILTRSRNVTINLQSRSNVRAVTFGGQYSVFEADRFEQKGVQRQILQTISRKTMTSGHSLSIRLSADFESQQGYYIWDMELQLIGLFSGGIEDWLHIRIN